MLFIEKELHKIKKEPQKYGSGINSIFCIMPIHPATCRGGEILGDYVKSGYTYADIEQGKHLKVNDHLGNRYKSKAAMAQAYGLSKFVFDKREKAGWSLDRILTTPVDESKTPKKHLR